MNINFENKLFQGVIDNSIRQELTIPFTKDLYSNPSLLSGKLNELRQVITQIGENTYKKANELDKQILKWNASYSRLLAQVELLESEVSDRLFLRSDSEGFFKTIYENFTVADAVDSVNSDRVTISYVENCVRIANKLQVSRQIGRSSYQINITRGSGLFTDRLVTVAGSSITNLYENNLSGWTAYIVSEGQGRSNLNINIDMLEPIKLGEIAISLSDINSGMTMSAIVTNLDNTTEIVLTDAEVSNTNIIPINRTAKKIQLILTKNLYDTRNYTEDTYRYIFHIRSLRLYANTTGNYPDGIFCSIAYPILNGSKFAIEVCDYESMNTKIEYYLKIINANIFNNNIYLTNITSSGSNGQISLDIVQDDSNLNTTGNYLLENITISNPGTGYQEGDVLKVLGFQMGFGGVSPGNDLTLTVGSVDGAGGILSFSAASGEYTYAVISQVQPINKRSIGNIPYGLYLNKEKKASNLEDIATVDSSKSPFKIIDNLGTYSFIQDAKYINSILVLPSDQLNAISVFGNHSLIAESENNLWEKVSDMYETWIYIEPEPEAYLNPGESGLIIEGIEKKAQGYPLDKRGWFKVRVPSSSYVDVGKTFTSFEQLTNVDPLYPFNGKYLIEGTNISEARYKGFRIRAKTKLRQVNNISLLDKNSFYVQRVPVVTENTISIGGNPFVIAVSRDNNLKNAYIEYRKNYNYSGYKVKLIAKMLTTDPGETPILASYKIKIGE